VLNLSIAKISTDSLFIFITVNNLGS